MHAYITRVNWPVSACWNTKSAVLSCRNSPQAMTRLLPMCWHSWCFLRNYLLHCSKLSTCPARLTFKTHQPLSCNPACLKTISRGDNIALV